MLIFVNHAASVTLVLNVASYPHKQLSEVLKLVPADGVHALIILDVLIVWSILENSFTTSMFLTMNKVMTPLHELLYLDHLYARNVVALFGYMFRICVFSTSSKPE